VIDEIIETNYVKSTDQLA